MNHKFTMLLGLAILLLTGIGFSTPVACSETLNPEQINPHASSPRKKITQEQRDAAWEARKKKKIEIELRKTHLQNKHQDKQNEPTSISETTSEQGTPAESSTDK